MSLNDLEVLRAACCVAGLDGEVSARELPLLKQLAERAGVGRVSLEAMMQKATSDRAFYEQQLAYLNADVEDVIRVLFKVAMADGRLSVEERVVLRYFADKLKIPAERFERFLQAAEKSPAQGSAGGPPGRSPS
jgi:uncharacterized tellurite resistance protein B-like protein